MTGISTRFAFKILSKVFNFDPTEIAANPVHLMYVLEQQIEREQFPPETEQKYLAFIKEHLAPRYAEFIGKEIQTAYLETYSRVRPEHLRPLRDLRRLLDPGPGVPRHRHRRDLRPRGAERRAGEDREAGRHRQPEGLPQRDRQLRAARARQQRRQEPGVDQLREAAHGDREEDVLEHRGAAAGDQLQRQGQRRRSRRSTRTSSTAWSRRATPPKQVRLLCEWYLRVRKSSAEARQDDHGTSHASADHRPAPGGQEQVDRQPRALPAPLQGADPRGGASRRSTAAASATSSTARTSRCPSATSSEPVFGHGHGGMREIVHPGQPGIRARRPHRAAQGGGGGGGSGARRATGEGEDDFVFRLTQRRVHAGLLRRPGAAAPDRARSCWPRRRSGRATRAGFIERRHARPTCTWCARCAARIGRRIAHGRRRARASCGELEDAARSSSKRRPTRRRRRDRRAEGARSRRCARGSSASLPRPDRPALPQPRARAGADQPRR